MANFDFNIPTRELKYNIQNGKLNKDNIISEILHEVKQGETPILNIQYNSNMEKPIIDTNDLAALKNQVFKLVVPLVVIMHIIKLCHIITTGHLFLRRPITCFLPMLTTKLGLWLKSM